MLASIVRSARAGTAARSVLNAWEQRMTYAEESGKWRRIAFQFKGTDDPVLQQEYKEHHKKVWPEMQAALKRQGFRNYSLFMRKDGFLIGYFESDRTLQECLDGMAKEPINAVWQEAMKKYFPSAAGKRPDEVMMELEEVMHLPLT